MCLHLEWVKDVLFDMTACFVCSYLFISTHWLTKGRSGSFWCGVGNCFLIWHANWLGISYYIKEYSSWIAQRNSIGALQQEDENEGSNKKEKYLSIIFFCCDYYTRLIIFLPSLLVTFNLVRLFSEVASGLLLRDSGTSKNNFKIVLVQNYKVCSCKKLIICMFSLQNRNKVLNFRFSTLFSMPNNKWMIKEERRGTLEKLFGSKGKILGKEIFTPLSWVKSGIVALL